MIDTIVLSLSEYTILDHSGFTPSTENIDKDRFGNQSWIKYVNNPKKQDEYKPRLTITKRIVKGGIIKPLKIELSVPKLLFGNNFDEIQESDFDVVLEKMLRKLNDMGIGVFRVNLVNAKIQAVHFAKNIAFTDYTTSSSIIRELAKIDLTKRLDLTRTKFKNEGHSLQYYAKSFSVVFYDKIKDPEMPKDRAVEQDNTIQLNILDQLKDKKPLEILRMEVRLCNGQKIKSLFDRLDIPQDLTFQAVFKQDIAKKVLNHYWEKTLENLRFTSFATAEPIDMMEAIVKNNDGLQLKTALSHFGALTLINSVGSRRFRQLVNENYSDRTWQRQKKNLTKLNISPVNKYQPFQAISRALDEFKPLKLADFDIKLKVY